ncbi:MAG: hypothetical protein CL783_01340 [Chloroflexi bacterium]|nr:hypothetical protein [Chloroflexota bacterium]|tara:strand:+ start:198 stop:608 length:411 start_codon:yes stop_codon:yes gene_type:complete
MRFVRKLILLGHLAMFGSLAGASTGFSWSVVVFAFSLDQNFDSTEAIISLSAPTIVSIVVWKITRIYLWITALVSYLTLLLPLFGLGLGGATMPSMTIAGAVGGLWWTVPIILYYLASGLRYKKDDAFFRKAGKKC